MLRTAISLHQYFWQWLFKNLFPIYINIVWYVMVCHILRTLFIFRLEKVLVQMVYNRKFQPQEFLISWFLYTGFYCIELLLQLKSAKAHGKKYIKVKPHIVLHLFCNCLFEIYTRQFSESLWRGTGRIR